MTLWIKDWDKVFCLKEAEKHEQVTWTKFPVSRAGLSYRRLMSTSSGRTAYCVFVGCVRIVARGKTKGELVDKGRELTASDMAAETGIPVPQCKAAIDLLKSAEVGWLTDTEPVSGRFENGEEPASERLQNGSRAEQSRADKKRENKKADGEPVGSVGISSRGNQPASLPTVADMLRDCGISGKAFDAICGCERITPQIVAREVLASRQGRPRSPSRVLAAALLAIAGVTLPRKGAQSLGASLALVGDGGKINELEKLRANRRGISA